MRKNLKKIESFISIKRMIAIDYICNNNGYNRAEFTRRALDELLNKLLKSKNKNIDLDDKIDELIASQEIK